MKLINLLPQENQKEVRLELAANIFLEFWIWVIATLLIFFIASLFAVFYLNSIIKATELSIYESQTILNSSDYKDLQVEISEINSHTKEINNIKNQHLYWSKPLLILAELIPSDVQLSLVTINRETGRVDIAGQARNRDSVITIWSNVIKTSYFQNINFPLKNLEKANFSDFNFTFYVNKEMIKQP